MNKKGFFITPIIFIVFFIIAVLFSYYISGIDNEIAYGIQKTASIEKAMHDIQKEQLSQIYLVKTTAYSCRKIENSCNEENISRCVDDALMGRFETDLNIEITNVSNTIYAEFDLSSFSARNINMTANSVRTKTELNRGLLGC